MKFLQEERGISEVQILGKTTTRVKADLRHRNKLLKQTETYEEWKARARILMQGQVVWGYPILQSPWLKSILRDYFTFLLD